MQKGNVYWITGLSGAGKTTIGKKLFEYLKDKKQNVVFLDGDILRSVFHVYDYSTEGRKALAFQYSRLCRMLSDQGIDVVICTIAMFDEVRLWNRKNIDKYVEIYLEVAIEELIKRDQKGLYTKAQVEEEKNVVGMNMEAELPKNPDLLIKNYGEVSSKDAFENVIAFLIEKKNADNREQIEIEMLMDKDCQAMQNICETLNCEDNEINNICILQAGLTNISFEFVVKDEKYVYRSAGSSAGSLVDRKTEVYSQNIARDIGIDESVIAIHEDGWKVSHFIEKTDFSMTENDKDLQMGMQYLKELHKVVPEVAIREFNDFEDGLHLFNIATENRNDLREQYHELIDKVRKVYEFAEAESKQLGIQKVLCHNDVYEANYLLDNDKKLFLIDWEYAGTNDPANDLACILCRESFSDEQIERYINAYYGHVPTNKEHRHMYAYIVLCAFYWFGWGMFKGKCDNDVGFFYEKAYENLIRFIDPVLEMYKEEI